MERQHQSRWQPTRGQVLRTAGIVGGLALLIIVICGYLFGWKWTGLPGRTLWSWLDLLIVPFVLAVGGFLFTRSENRATQAAAAQRAQDEALQAYLDQMSNMLTPNKDQPSLYEESDEESDERSAPNIMRSVARARTLTVFPRLDGDRKARVVQFLSESRLIIGERPVLSLKKAGLSGADLREAYLGGADLEEADLSQVLSNGTTFLGSADLFKAKMSGMNLSGANVNQANLRAADLSRADLGRTYLYSAQLKEANLKEANLKRAKLSGADLSGADLRGADLREADLGRYRDRLEGADLSGADLSGARGVAYEQLDKAKSLEGATMPNGQKYEEWIKSGGRVEGGRAAAPRNRSR